MRPFFFSVEMDPCYIWSTDLEVVIKYIHFFWQASLLSEKINCFDGLPASKPSLATVYKIDAIIFYMKTNKVTAEYALKEEVQFFFSLYLFSVPRALIKSKGVRI